MIWACLLLVAQSVYAGGKAWTFSGADESAIRMPGSWGARALDDPTRAYCPVELVVDVWSRGLDAEGYGWAYIVCQRSTGAETLPVLDIPVQVIAQGYLQDGAFIAAWNGPGWGPAQDTPLNGKTIACFFYPIGWPDNLWVAIQAAGAHYDGYGNVIARVGPFSQRTVDWRDILSGRVQQ